VSHSSDFYTEHPHARYVSVAAPREDRYLEHRMHALSIICPWIGGSSNAAAAEQALARILYKATMISSQPKEFLYPATARALSRPLVQSIFYTLRLQSSADSADNTTITQPLRTATLTIIPGRHNAFQQLVLHRYCSGVRLCGTTLACTSRSRRWRFVRR